MFGCMESLSLDDGFEAAGGGPLEIWRGELLALNIMIVNTVQGAHHRACSLRVDDRGTTLDVFTYVFSVAS